jgi:hypothetical protein
MNSKSFIIFLTAVIIVTSTFGLLAINQRDALQAKLDAPPVAVHALGIFACGKMYAIVVTQSNGDLLAVTPHSPVATQALNQAKDVPPAARSSLALEVQCGQPDTSTDRR